MATTNSISGSSDRLRLSGLASGMDTESMVKSLMKAEKAKYDKIAQQKTKLEWTKEANLSVNNLIRDFKDKYMSAINRDTYMLSSSSVVQNKVTVNGSGVSITANGSAQLTSHKIEVLQLATGANASSSSSISAAGELSQYVKLKDLPLSQPLTFEDGVMSFSINGQMFSFSQDDTLETVLNRVNNNAAANVNMSYSSLTGKITVQSRLSGSDLNPNQVVIKNIKGNAFSATNSAFGIAEGSYTNGTKARVKIDDVTVERSTNAFSIDNVTYKLTAQTTSAVNFTVEQDTDASVKKISDFVDSYNTLMTKLNSLLSEEKKKGYDPLTEDQKAEMSETEIDKWETAAKSGLLRNDANLRELRDSLRRSFYTKVTAADTSASSIGLGTISYKSNGLITLDVSKLRTALEQHPEQVNAVFTAKAQDNSTNKFADSGVSSRVNDLMNAYLNEYADNRGDITDDEIDDLEDRLSTMSDKLADKEDQYWKKFNAMETALQQLNSQSSWITSMLGNSGSQS